APFWTNQAAYASVFGPANRIILASLVAYLISQSFDLWAFTWLKERFQGRHLWLRNNLSTAASQLIDTLIFITVAFYGTEAFPSILDLWPLIGGQLAVKWIIAVADTPLVYALVYFLRGHAQSPPRPAGRQAA
ncbi:MAG: queuosine precursor transporter, partial [bacterium]